MGKEKYNKEELIRLLIHEGKSYKEVAAMRGDGSTGEAIRKAANRYGIKVSDRKKLRKCEYCGKEHDGSFGERIIKTWLKNNISKNCWDREKRFTNIQGRNIDWGVVIDFVININGKTYWIEYNGEQHYELRLGSIIYKHYTEEEALEVFQKQLVRDKNVRKYCKENNIILVEIPYSYNTYKKISVLLFNILIENKDPEDIINIPKIKYRKED